MTELKENETMIPEMAETHPNPEMESAHAGVDPTQHLSFGGVLCQPIENITYNPERTDIMNINNFNTVILDILHLTLGGCANNPLASNLISAAITEVIKTNLLCKQALAFANRVAINDSEEQEEAQEKGN